MGVVVVDTATDVEVDATVEVDELADVFVDLAVVVVVVRDAIPPPGRFAKPIGAAEVVVAPPVPEVPPLGAVVVVVVVAVAAFAVTTPLATEPVTV